MMRKMYGDQTNAPKFVPVKVLSDLHSKLGYEYVPYNEFNISKTQRKVNIKHTDIKKIYPDCMVSNTDKCAIEHRSTPSKHIPNTDTSNIKHTNTPTKYGLPDPILSQSDIIHVHQQ